MKVLVLAALTICCKANPIRQVPVVLSNQPLISYTLIQNQIPSREITLEPEVKFIVPLVKIVPIIPTDATLVSDVAITDEVSTSNKLSSSPSKSKIFADNRLSPAFKYEDSTAPLLITKPVKLFVDSVVNVETSSLNHAGREVVFPLAAENAGVPYSVIDTITPSKTQAPVIYSAGRALPREPIFPLPESETATTDPYEAPGAQSVIASDIKDSEAATVASLQSIKAETTRTNAHVTAEPVLKPIQVTNTNADTSLSDMISTHKSNSDPSAVIVDISDLELPTPFVLSATPSPIVPVLSPVKLITNPQPVIASLAPVNEAPAPHHTEESISSVILASAPEPLEAPEPPMPSVGVPFVGGQFHSQDEAGEYSFGHWGGPNTRVEIRDSLGRTSGSFAYVDPNGDVQVRKYAAGPVSGFRVAASDLPGDSANENHNFPKTP